MMTQQLGFSILSAPLAAIDRRVLSQAWYSALHRASNLARAQSGPVKEPLAFASARSSACAAQRQPRRKSRLEQPPASQREAASRPGPVESDRRSTRSALARKIERAFLHPLRSARRVTLTLDDGRKIQVTLQKGHRGLLLVAVCAPGVRESVARALEQARYALAVRGITLQASVSTSVAAC